MDSSICDGPHLEMLFVDDLVLHVNKNQLQQWYDAGSLQKADVFACLFQLNHCPLQFKSERMHKNAANQITIAQALCIKSSDWICLMSFLKVSTFENFNPEQIRVLDTISTKLGGIPSVDSCFEDYCKSLIQSKQHKWSNPQTPAEDKNNLFIWRTYLMHCFPDNSEFSVTCPCSPVCVYARKPRQSLHQSSSAE